MNIVHIDTLIRDFIYLEAEKVRKWAIRKNDYSYDLMNLCVTCSYMIFRVLDRYKLEPEFCNIFVGPGSHAFVYCQGYIIDVTATQFKVKTEVVVRKNEGKHRLYFWNLKQAQRFSNIKEVKSVINHRWHRSCRPQNAFQEKRNDRGGKFGTVWQRKCDALCA